MALKNENNLIQQSLLDIWSMVLKLPSVSLTDNFFEVGGDSLLALMVIEQIKQRLGWQLDLADLLRSPTIDELYQHHREPRVANQDKVMIRMSRRGQETPIIFIHPVCGLIFSYAHLIKNMSQNRTCYGIQALATENFTVPKTLSQMAENYADIIYGEIGEEAFNLCGWSLGGVIGFEIARIAAEKDLNLQKLVMIDSYSSLPEGSSLKVCNEQNLLKEFYGDILSQMFSDKSIIFKPDSSLDPEILFSKIANDLLGPQLNKEAEGAAIRFVKQVYDVYQGNLKVFMNHQIMPAKVSCLLLHSIENDTVNHWGAQIKGDFSHRSLEVNHYDFMSKKYAETISEHIKTYFEENRC